MPVILYAEFTAKPGSESQVQVLISDLAEKVRQEPGITHEGLPRVVMKPT